MKTIAFPAVVLLCLLAAIGEFSTGHAATDTNLNLTITRLNQSAVLSWFGSNAMAYQVEVSSNLTVWSNAGPPCLAIMRCFSPPIPPLASAVSSSASSG